ncbi:hypothetical protein CB0940_06929 [Cercospora beticola]|uniref:Vegetative cell wall protein gp1 n=1 Tax=Cercospora beticola TaxID=122368 RepID=A0A2G5H7N8_CERBT|nr:hypothetical protein CB0940_06929 [Cercospora beticola]PIA88545.1 hypothetical protein CB0940_06929 [Cercospora beticola]WPB02847.1 hypothetical protein RHO25_007483 [Cercospora beticola]CAK1358461.1 unnamed protein product [Cercospora beticola]
MATFQTAGYPVPPPGYGSYYRTPPQTPPPAAGYNAYYSPRNYSYSGQSKGHARRATGDGTTAYNYSYSATPTPRKTSYYATGRYSTPEPTYHTSAQSTPQRKTDYVPIYTPAADTEQTPRPRRASHGPKTTHAPPPRRPSTATKPPPKATEEDARRAGIPAGYSYKNWDPTEEPILLLGSVFDANSLGKWIYDWTVFFYGPATPMSEVAGEMWLLLIQLAHKVRRAEDIMPKIRSQASRDLVDDFLESGERLWQRFNKLLKICENYMWKAAKKASGGSKNVTMGKDSGSEFVDTIFGRDRELERTEKLMTGMRLWSMRFDANCEEILRNPGK